MLRDMSHLVERHATQVAIHLAQGLAAGDCRLTPSVARQLKRVMANYDGRTGRRKVGRGGGRGQC